MRHASWITRGFGVTALVLLSTVANNARAVPSFARQTGLPCQQCHTVAPELTAFGRLFKLNGFVLNTLPKVEAPSGDGNIPTELIRMPPVAVELDVADSTTSKSQPGSQNGSAQFPSKAKIFFAGAVSDHIGVFNYFEYTQPDDHFSIDLTDVRIASSGQMAGRDVVYGITVNNAPTLEDPWNTLNVWGFPHVGSEVAPSPGAAPLLGGGGLADSGSVAGVGGYMLWDNHLYADVSLYRPAPTGVAQPLNTAGNLIGTVPYVRLAWQQTFSTDYLEAGLSFINAKFRQGISGSGAPGLDDHYSDWGLDAQYEHPIGPNQLTLHAKYIHENQTLDSSSGVSPAPLSNPSDSLKALNVDGTYLIRGGNAGYAVSLGYFSITGSADLLLYAPGAVSGFTAGKPDSDGWILQGTYLPYANTQFTLQYVIYSKFNGASSNYDGSGRNASDNNTLFLLMMIDW